MTTKSTQADKLRQRIQIETDFVDGRLTTQQATDALAALDAQEQPVAQEPIGEIVSINETQATVGLYDSGMQIGMLLYTAPATKGVCFPDHERTHTIARALLGKPEHPVKSKRIAIKGPIILAIDYRPDGTIAAVAEVTHSDKINRIFALGYASPASKPEQEPASQPIGSKPEVLRQRVESLKHYLRSCAAAVGDNVEGHIATIAELCRCDAPSTEASSDADWPEIGCGHCGWEGKTAEAQFRVPLGWPIGHHVCPKCEVPCTATFTSIAPSAAPCQPARDAIIEECAKVCDKWSIQPGVAERIRALKGAPISGETALDDAAKQIEALKFRKRELETEVSDLRNTLTVLKGTPNEKG